MTTRVLKPQPMPAKAYRAYKAYI